MNGATEQGKNAVAPARGATITHTRYTETMENTNTTNAPVLKSRRTYLLAGIPCLCWDGALYAPLSGVSANLGAIQVGAGPTPATVAVHGPAGLEHWHLESREEIKARGAKARRPSARAEAPAAPAQVAQPETVQVAAAEPEGEPSALADRIAELKEKKKKSA
jgi:hypothetical protein